MNLQSAGQPFSELAKSVTRPPANLILTPRIGAIPASLHAVTKRMAPAKLSRSVNASADISS